MLSDGYFDMSLYIHRRLNKDVVYATLAATKSKYAALYKKPYPQRDKACSVWKKTIESHQDNKPCVLTNDEASAIVNWVYRIFNNRQEREEFSKTLLTKLKEFHSIQNDIRFAHGVIYNSQKVEVHFVSTVAEVNSYISRIKLSNSVLFFRGHASANYTLKPSIMRTPQLEQNESSLYNELLINCPNDFVDCHSHLEKLVKMQHYGMPTRLLDITRNPLVALYFACESHLESYGELVLIVADSNGIKYPQSDTVSIISSLPNFSFLEQCKFKEYAADENITKPDFNQKISRLIHEVRLEKPAFQPDVDPHGILKSYIVYALKNNSRIVKQDGAFILCGLGKVDESLEKFRYCDNNKRVILLIENKKEILKQLDNYSVNRASLFPEIENVAEYLKNKYTN